MAWLSALILLLFYSLTQVASEEYYITANSTDLCTSSCQTLTEFITNFTYLLNPNITVVFGPGRHYLNGSLTVSNLNTFSTSSENITAQIECTDYSGMIFNYSQNVFITNLEFIGCGGNQMMNVDNFLIHDTTFVGQDNRGITLQLIQTTGEITNCAFSSLRRSIRRTTGDTITAINSNINISQSIFKNNGARVLIFTEHTVQSFVHGRVSFTYMLVHSYPIMFVSE